MTTAAVIIIGEEILSGKFPDENGPYLIRRLRALGVRLRHMAVISDELDHIADEVRRAAERYDLVFTTGGVGPTHDDRTFEGIARAFGRPLVEEPTLVALLERFDLPRNDATMRMARVPEGSRLIDAPGLIYPIVAVEQVHVFPGVPRLLQQKFEVIAPRFATERVKAARIYAMDLETDVAERMTRIAAEHPDVEIGSYPRFGETRFRLILTLESHDEAALTRATEALRAILHVVEVDGP